jgi:hypothetical protein
VFSYLAELHDRKMAAGQIANRPAAQALAPAAAAGDASADGSAAARAAPAVIAEVVTPSGAPGGKSGESGKGWSGAAAAMPATVELQPSKRRGKKSLGQRAAKAATKAKSQCYS